MTEHPHSVVLKEKEHIHVLYRNWRGLTSVRDIEITSAPYWGSTEWHPKPCWLVCGRDIEKNEARIWSVMDMTPV